MASTCGAGAGGRAAGVVVAAPPPPLPIEAVSGSSSRSSSRGSSWIGGRLCIRCRRPNAMAIWRPSVCAGGEAGVDFNLAAGLVSQLIGWVGACFPLRPLSSLRSSPSLQIRRRQHGTCCAVLLEGLARPFASLVLDDACITATPACLIGADERPPGVWLGFINLLEQIDDIRSRWNNHPASALTQVNRSTPHTDQASRESTTWASRRRSFRRGAVPRPSAGRR